MTQDVEKNDESLARAVQQGDSGAFNELVKRYEAKMLRYARKFLFRGDDCKDVVQEVFIKAYINIKSFDPNRRFSPWLYRIAHNEFINAVKKKIRLPFSFDLDAVFPHPLAKETADSDADRGDIKKMLDRSLERIGPKYREVLVLYYYEDFDYKEIAEILKIPISTVGVRLSRGKAELKQHMTKDN